MSSEVNPSIRPAVPGLIKPVLEAEASSVQTLKKLTTFSNGRAVTYIGGFTERLTHAEHSLQKLSELQKQHPNSPLLTSQVSELKSDLEILTQKQAKVEKVVRAASKIRATPAEGAWTRVYVRPKFFALRRVYYVSADETGLKIVSGKFLHERLKRTLGKGSYGVVTGDVLQMHTGVVAKRAATHTPGEMQQAIKDLYNEEKLLKIVHKDGKVLGIVDVPKAVVRISNEDARMITEQYDTDLDKLRKDPQQDRSLIFRGFANMFKGLAETHAKGVFHGDIKPENIGVFRTSRNDPLRLADWGGATQIRPGESLHMGSSTEAYFPRELYKLLTTAKKENNHKLFRDLQSRRDYYALAKCLAETLLPKLSSEDQQIIFKYQKTGHFVMPSLDVNTTYLADKLENAGYDSEVASLLTNMFQACDPRRKTIDSPTIERWKIKLEAIGNGFNTEKY